jgi:hypothetical protein
MSFLDDLSDLSSKIGEKLGGKEKYQPVALIAGSVLLTPAIAGAYKATLDANAIQAAREAATAAGSQIAQVPYTTAQNIGMTGEIQFTKGITSWIPIGLIFILLMYLLFKD